MKKTKYLLFSAVLLASMQSVAQNPINDNPAYSIVGKDSTCQVFIYSPAENQGLHLLGVVPQDETVYEYDCEGKPTAALPEDNPVKKARREIVDKLGL